MSTVAKSSPVRQVSSKDLKQYLNAGRKQAKVSGAVERHLMTRPLDTSRRQDVLHPSEIVKPDWCLRESYWRIIDARNGIYPDIERPGLRLQMIFDTGNAIHTRWQTYLGLTGNLYGNWTCGGCGKTTTPGLLPTAPCTACGTTGQWGYEELGLHHGLIHGHTDGWLVGLGERDSLLEIKSIGTGTIRTYDMPLLMDADGDLEKAFGNIRRPFLDHRRQGQMYLRLAHAMHDAGELERPAPEEITFLYECKANQATKEFTVAYDPNQVDDVFEGADDLAWHLDHGQAPACSVKHDSCPKCSKYTDRTTNHQEH